MDLLIYSSNLVYIGIIDSYISFRWVRRYSKCGEFELHCVYTPAHMYYLTRTNIISRKGDLEAGVINAVRIRQKEDGTEVIIASGSFLTGYLRQRLIWGSKVLSTTSEVAIRTLIMENSITPTLADRIIPFLELDILHNFTETVNYQVDYKNLLEEIENLADTTKLGIRTKLDAVNKKIIFDTYSGVDRTIEQSVNPRAIFSKEFDNILNSEYVDSLNTFANVALVEGVEEEYIDGINNYVYVPKFVTVGSATGLDRYEIFTSQGTSMNNEGEPLTEEEYNNILIGKGNEALAAAKELKTFTSTVMGEGNTKYKVDFDLGDLVTVVSKRWGITLNTRVTAVEEVYEGVDFKLNIMFGNDTPTILSKVKNLIKLGTSKLSGVVIPITNIDGGTFI